MEVSISIFCVAGVFSLLAGVSAFLIFYEEYSRHYADRRKALKTALEAAIFTIAVFLGIGLMLAVLLPHYF